RVMAADQWLPTVVPAGRSNSMVQPSAAVSPSLAIATSAPYPVSHADVRVIRAVSRSAAAVVRAAVSAAVGAAVSAAGGAGAAGAPVAVARARRRALARAAAAAAGRDGRRAGVMWGAPSWTVRKVS